MLHLTPENTIFRNNNTCHPAVRELFIQSDCWPEIMQKPMLAVVGADTLAPTGGRSPKPR